MSGRPSPFPLQIQRWSTQDAAPARGLDLYAEALTSAVDPMHVTSRQRRDFKAEVRASGNEDISVVAAHAGAHDCMRDEHEIAASGERCFHLIINTTSSWRLTHRGEVTLRPRDAVLLDSYLPHLIELPEFSIAHIRMSSSWLRQWLGEPERLVGRVLPHDQGWSRSLAAFAAQLTPELLAAPPIPVAMLGERVAAGLALVASELAPARQRVPAGVASLGERVRDVIRQRCTESGLQAQDVARDACVSTRTLHRSLAASGRTFTQTLIEMRLDLAMNLMMQPACDGLTLDEIAHRAGFANGSHFGRIMRLQTGTTPAAFRRSRRDRAGGR